jgi:hypothetical protein
MKKAVASGLAVIAAAAVLAAPVAASAAPSNLMPQSSESVGPKAKGPTPYQASRLANCVGNSCQVRFGKKTKVRRITNISCLFISSTGVALGALLRVDEGQITYLPFNSRAPSGAGEFASGALAIDFAILGGERLTIEFASSGTAADGNCVIVGTIE